MSLELMRRAERWRLLGLLFECPGPGWAEELCRLADELGDQDLASFVESAVEGAEAAREGRYLRVLGPGGSVSPRAVGYRPMGDPGRLLADLAGWYEAFAYRPRLAEPPDHLAVEVGFVGFLTFKEAYALACEDADSASRVRETRRAFVEEHLADLAVALAQRLEIQPVDYLRMAIRALLDELGVDPVSRRALPVVQAAPHAIEVGGQGCPGGGGQVVLPEG